MNLNRLWHPWDREDVEFFTLGDLWSCFDEWSAYGARVSIKVDDDGDDETNIQCYVPYLSAIQIFTSKSLKVVVVCEGGGGGGSGGVGGGCRL
ncbi:hypothetical protein Hdeb2414_s0003g00108271 [Helianthus debilis subsp. tardiflorus]